MAAAANPRVAEAVQRVRFFTADEQRRLDLESRDKWLRDQITRENTARKEGLAEGRAEERAAMVRRLLARGLALPDVAEVADLSLEEVRALSDGSV